MALKYGGTITESVLSDSNNTFTILINEVGINKKVLELGCASGYLTKVLKENNRCLITAFEIDSAAAEIARKYANEIFVGDLESEEDISQIKGEFDVILIADVLEHLVNPQITLRRIQRHLSNKGRLIVSLPNVAHWSNRRNLLLGHWNTTEKGLMDHTHLRWFTLQTGQELIENEGFLMEKTLCSYVFPGHNRGEWAKQFSNWIHANGYSFFPSLFGIQNIYVATLAN